MRSCDLKHFTKQLQMKKTLKISAAKAAEKLQNLYPEYFKNLSNGRK